MELFPSTLAFIGDLAGPEMLLVLVIVLVLFGGDKLPEFARGLGKSIREFKKAATGVEEEFKRALEEDERKHIAPPPPSFPPYPPAPALTTTTQPQLSEAPPADTSTMKLAEPPLPESPAAADPATPEAPKTDPASPPPPHPATGSGGDLLP